MNTINFPKGIVISAFNGPTELITKELLIQIYTPVETNKFKIIDAAMDIERIINEILAYFFFKRNEGLKLEAEEFKNQVLNSDWCSFSSKRKLLFHFINTNDFLKGQEKSEFDKLLKKVMSYRNSFAHGELSTDGREVRLQFFEGSLRTISLTEDYFIQIEKDLINCWELLHKVAFNCGAFIKSDILNCT